VAGPAYLQNGYYSLVGESLAGTSNAIGFAALLVRDATNFGGLSDLAPTK
jgi:hypothetical protein